MPISNRLCRQLTRLDSDQGTKWRPLDCSNHGDYKATDWQTTGAAAGIIEGSDRFNELVQQKKANRTMWGCGPVCLIRSPIHPIPPFSSPAVFWSRKCIICGRKELVCNCPCQCEMSLAFCPRLKIRGVFTDRHCRMSDGRLNSFSWHHLHESLTGEILSQSANACRKIHMRLPHRFIYKTTKTQNHWCESQNWKGKMISFTVKYQQSSNCHDHYWADRGCVSKSGFLRNNSW